MSFTTPVTGPQLNVLVAVFPGFQLLDVAGPLDMFNFLSGPPYNARISMSFVAETKDGVGTKLIDRAGSSGGWRYDLAGVGFGGDGGVNKGWNQEFVVDRTFDEVLQGKDEWDLLFIPGGAGSRVRRVRDGQNGGEEERELAVAPLVEFTKAMSARLRLGIMTVCTGSDILGWTGLIDGRRATTNMSRFDDVSGRHGKVAWVKGARWVKSPREEGKAKGQEIEIWTSAGVSAGIDVALAFIAEKFGGMDLSRDIAKKAEYDWAEPKDGEICRFYDRYFGVS